MINVAVDSNKMTGAYLRIVRKDLFRRSLCKGRGLNQYAMSALSKATSTETASMADTNRIGTPKPYVQQTQIVLRIWAYFFSI